MVRVAVIGAGVVGLSTALNIQSALPTASVRVIADKFGSDTTSAGAGGLFRPNVDHAQGASADTVRRWSTNTWNFFRGLLTSSECGKTGHMLQAGYVLSNTPVKDPLYKSIVFSFRELTPEELKNLGINYKYGYQVTTIITDTSKYMPWLLDRFRRNGGEVEERTVETLEEFVGQYDVVVNCTALRSQGLVDDKESFPVRGHLIRVHAPWIKNWVYTDDNAYFIPRSDGTVSLGGLRQKDRYDTEILPEDTRGILQRCYKLWPSLQGAPVQGEWVGLRPHRKTFRLESETMNFRSGSLKVVHNYGHGANGITLSWGTAIEAAQRVKQLATNNSPTSKL